VTALALEPRTDQDPVLLPVPTPRESLPAESLSLSELVACYDGMVRATARRYRLQDSDVDDVAQTTWLRLVQSLDRIENRACVPGWLATTTRRESMRVLRQRQREVAVDLERDPTWWMRTPPTRCEVCSTTRWPPPCTTRWTSCPPGGAS
jgi:DNA-directed RNA polymerase specialized sigma24 family protein